MQLQIFHSCKTLKNQNKLVIIRQLYKASQISITKKWKKEERHNIRTKDKGKTKNSKPKTINTKTKMENMSKRPGTRIKIWEEKSIKMTIIEIVQNMQKIDRCLSLLSQLTISMSSIKASLISLNKSLILASIIKTTIIELKKMR